MFFNIIKWQAENAKVCIKDKKGGRKNFLTPQKFYFPQTSFNEQSFLGIDPLLKTVEDYQKYINEQNNLFADEFIIEQIISREYLGREKKTIPRGRTCNQTRTKGYETPDNEKIKFYSTKSKNKSA